MQSQEEIRREIAYFMRRLYRQRLTTTSGGNISQRCGSDAIFITPSGSDKGRMKSADIGRVGFDGASTDPLFRPSIESRMHVAIYRTRPDVGAIVHAHPVACCAIASGTSVINTRYLSESHAILKEIAYVEYHLMGTEGLAGGVATAAVRADCLVMRNHGVLAVGSTLLQAFDRLEVLEAAAAVTLLNGSILRDSAKELDREELTAIDRLMNR
jgi:L-fuculose-phosphate aldolase